MTEEESKAKSGRDLRLYVGIKQAANLLEMNRQYVRKLFIAGKFPSATRDSVGKWLAKKSEIEAYKANRQKPAPAGHLTVEQIAAKTGYNEQYVRKLCKANRWKAIKVGGRWYAKESDVEKSAKRDDPMPANYISVQEFATKVGYNLHYARKLCAEGKLTATKHNNRWIVKETDVQEVRKIMQQRIEQLSDNGGSKKTETKQTKQPAPTTK